MSSKRSRVHPTFKTKYRVGNWHEYDAGLVNRGDLTVWISQEATDSWKPKPTGARGGQRRFANAPTPEPAHGHGGQRQTARRKPCCLRDLRAGLPPSTP